MGTTRSQFRTTATEMQSPPSYLRRARHSGSWYSSDASDLSEELEDYLQIAIKDERSSEPNSGTPRAIVSPHAGFRYSGPTAGYAYAALREALLVHSQVGDNGERGSLVKTIVVLHPSHHVRLDGCSISGAATIETPISNLEVDDELRTELLNTGEFTIMKRNVDEAEHSGEMQYPFISQVLKNVCTSSPSVVAKVLPIMVGGISTSEEARFGRILAPFLARKSIFVVISSDFCHWGRRFGYTPTGDNYKRGGDDISEYIERLDKMGMDHIESQKPGAFASYLRQSRNTICGRHPIAVWMNCLVENQKEADGDAVDLDVKFVKYDQSSRVSDMDDSSVSYASAVARTKGA